MPPQRIAVTGGNGFVGRTICRMAHQSGYEVVAVVRRPCDLLGAVRVVVTSLLDKDGLADAFRGCSAVVHTAGLAHVIGRAAQNEAAFHTANARGTEAVARAARAVGVRQLVLASSVAVYGGADPEGTRESAAAEPKTAYARSKLAAERAAQAIFFGHGCLTILRFATVYGEGDQGNVSRLISALRRRRFVWPGAGLNRKSLIYHEDAAEACLLALRHMVHGVYNISADPVTMREIVESISVALERSVPQARIPAWVLKMARVLVACVRPLQPLDRQITTFLNDDIYLADSFANRFGWRPRVALREGIKRQVSSLRIGKDIQK